MRPQLAGLAKKHGDKVVVLKVNVDRQRTLTSMAGVRSIPDRRLFFGGRQLDRSVGGLSRVALERMVLKHEGVIEPFEPQAESAPVIASEGPLQRLERNMAKVSSDNQRQWPEDKVATSEPSNAAKPNEEAELKSGTIKPMAKDWLPPGVTRVK